MVKKKDKSWQYTFSTALAGITLFLVLGYFIQSFIEIRKVKPVSVAIERIMNSSSESSDKFEDAKVINNLKTEK
ncbi:MAG: hypothetical protein GQ546_11815 [Gammaproteobacteria bacterium]|jgi:hypothetical protein|nr:hypothetical protein [Gammaproteobacteria bacterium]